MKTPLVSWLMPVYNGGKFLRQALDSMINQTYQNFEVIVVIEHGCSDNSAAICAEYSARDERVQVYQNEENLGIARSLNRGLDLCKGKYIARMDADDISYPNRLEMQVQYMESNPNIGVLGTGHRIITDHDEREVSNPLDCERIRAKLLFMCFFAHPTVMFRAQLFRQNGWKYPACASEDYALWAMLSSKTKMAVLPCVLLDYNCHHENASFVKFNAVRAASAQVSRAAIRDELGVDTSTYDDMLFGWKDGYLIPYDLGAFLCSGARLFREMWLANKRLRKFDDDALFQELNCQWQEIKSMVYLGMLTVGYDDIAPKTLDKTITDTIERLTNIFAEKKRVIVYGVGKYCRERLGGFEGQYPFEIVAFCDSSESKQGQDFFGHTIISPEQLSGFKYDYILVGSPIYELEIRDRLITEFLIPQDKIISLMCIDELSFHARRAGYDKLYSHECGKRKTYLFCAPDYGNLGDHAIAEAERRFFWRRLGLEICEVSFGRYHEAAEIARHHILPSDLVLITGGGFLGSLWFLCEQQVRNIIETYPNNPVIILPQSLYWEDTVRWKTELAETQRVYAAHTNLTLCARDIETLRLMKQAYPNNRVLLVPDMALAENWSGFFDDDATRSGAMICLKNDLESILTDAEKEKICSVAKGLCGHTFCSDTDLKIPVSSEERIRLLQEKLNETRKSELVITDRLHGSIFAAITGTPCVVLNNCNHKLKKTFEWIRHLPYLHFAENVERVRECAIAALAAGPGKYDMAPMMPSFDHLENYIREIMT